MTCIIGALLRPVGAGWRPLPPRFLGGYRLLCSAAWWSPELALQFWLACFPAATRFVVAPVQQRRCCCSGGARVGGSAGWRRSPAARGGGLSRSARIACQRWRHPWMSWSSMDALPWSFLTPTIPGPCSSAEA
jgi:hypothetical protein